VSAIEAAMFGTLGRDGEAKTSKTGKLYLCLNIRVGDGDTAQWVSATVFDAKAIELADKMLKGASVYLEGRISLDEWVGLDERHGLSMMSGRCRLAQIGRNKSKPERDKPDTARAALGSTDADLNADVVPF
jgi:single-stranded DNA-binding protein